MPWRERKQGRRMGMLGEMQGCSFKWGCQGRASESDRERGKAGEGVGHMQVWESVLPGYLRWGTGRCVRETARGSRRKWVRWGAWKGLLSKGKISFCTHVATTGELLERFHQRSNKDGLPSRITSQDTLKGYKARHWGSLLLTWLREGWLDQEEVLKFVTSILEILWK